MLKLSTYPLLSFVLLLGCGRDVSQESGKLNFSNPFKFDLSKMNIDSNSPSGIGTLISKTKIDKDRTLNNICNWFLIDKNLAMTSSSCIPKELKEASEIDCRNHLSGKIKTNSGEVEVRCKKVLYVSELSHLKKLNNDFALIELDKDVEDSDYYQLDRTGVSSSQEVTVLALSHSPRPDVGFDSRYSPFKCLVKSSDIFGLITSFGSSPVYAFKEEFSHDECHSHRGNEGAPVLSQEGKLIGVLNNDNENGEELVKQVKISNNITKSRLLFTNLSCQKFNHPKLDNNIPSSCTKVTVNEQSESTKNKSEIDYWIDLDLKYFRGQFPSYLEFHESSTPSGKFHEYGFRPKCIKPLSLWDEKDLKRIYVDNGKSIRTSYTESIETGYSISVNHYGNYKNHYNSLTSDSQYLIISQLDKLEENQRVEVEIHEPGVLSVRRPETFSLWLCE